MKKKRDNKRFELNSNIANVINFDGHKVLCIGSASIDLSVCSTDDGRYDISVWVQSGHSRKQVLSCSWGLTDEEYEVVLEDTKIAKEDVFYPGINRLVANAVLYDLMLYYLEGALYPVMPFETFDDEQHIKDWMRYMRQLTYKRMGKSSTCQRKR